ncbi:TetR family transcriptional regulator [Aquabacterium sp.]|uniref:TetR family transcriptional regulator n=1 Tax=Aquabacterium sp. TaxID=1872578 RepID=UPI002C6E4806|nr:TetR family transcriptional regulator [Aquabacterium sp.]HSW09087.1 TetR family transcriptional regulator [Aquabacterium sp.]
MVRRTKDEALATRHCILDAAELLFQQQGVSRTSLQEIAQAAALTRGAIYWHFKDKADLFNAMMERATMPLEESMAAASGDETQSQDPLTFIEERLVQALHLTVHHAPTRRVFEIATHKVEYVDELQAVRERHLHNRNECLVQVEQQLKLATKRGQINKRTPPRSAALGLHALVDGLIQNWLLDPQAFDLVRVGRQVLRAYLAGLRPDEAA